MIARIVARSGSVETFGFVDVSPETEGIDLSMPTLIVGKQKAEEMFGKDRVKMLNRNIEGDIWWTFARTDRRDEYERDLERFNALVIKRVEEGVKYVSFNIFAEPRSRVRDFVRFMEGDSDKDVFATQRQVYTYCDGVVIGLSLDEAEYCGVPRRKVLRRIFENPHNRRVDGNGVSDSLLRRMTTKANYMVPYLSFLGR